MRHLIASAVGLLALGACQHGAPASPAVLSDGSPETLAKLQATLADAMGVASVRLGAGDPTQTSTISVLPPALNPSEDRSTALPVQFDLILEGQTCYAIRQGTDEKLLLTDIPCQAA